MTLEQLRVDSYSTHVSEQELTEVKGGTTPVCIVALAILVSSCTVNNNKTVVIVAGDGNDVNTGTSQKQDGTSTGDDSGNGNDVSL